MIIEKKRFGTADGTPVLKFRIRNKNGMVLSLISLGAAMTGLTAPDRNGNFGDVLTLAMFIGLVSAYLGSYIGQFTADKNIVPIITALVAAAVMGVFYYFTEKRKIAWLDNFSIAASMLAGMAAAVVVSLI